MTNTPTAHEWRQYARTARRFADMLAGTTFPAGNSFQRANASAIQLDAESVAAGLELVANSARERAEADREKRDDRRAEEVREVAHMIGGASL